MRLVPCPRNGKARRQLQRHPLLQFYHFLPVDFQIKIHNSRERRDAKTHFAESRAGIQLQRRQFSSARPNDIVMPAPPVAVTMCTPGSGSATNCGSVACLA
jgi:hypothetical protein